MLATEQLSIDQQVNGKDAHTTAQCLADAYLAATLGTDFHAVRGFCGNQRWYFLIEYQGTAGEEARGVGVKLVVDLGSQAVLPLTVEQIEAILAMPAVQLAQRRGEFARDQDGYLLRYQAQRNATAYLRTNLSMHYQAKDGLFVPTPQARWQFSIDCQLGQTNQLGPLGVVTVDAQTGDVIPINPSQLQQIRNRVDAVIQHQALAPAA